MSEAARQLLTTFESPTLQEQHDVLTTLLRRSQQIPELVLSSEDLSQLADNLFQVLDTEESHGNESSTK